MFLMWLSRIDLVNSCLKKDFKNINQLIFDGKQGVGEKFDLKTFNLNALQSLLSMEKTINI